MDAHRRVAIVYKYELLGCPPQSEWGKQGGTMRQIADFIGMPESCNYQPVRSVLERHLAGEDILKHRSGQGRPAKLPVGQQLIAADCLRRGTGQEQAAHILSAWRESRGMPLEQAAVSRRVVQTAVVHLGGVHNRRGTTSTGSRDPESKWATSRDAQATQWKAQVETPEQTAAAFLSVV